MIRLLLMMKTMGFQAAHIAIGPRCVEKGVAHRGLFDGFARSDIERVRGTGTGRLMLMIGAVRHDGGHDPQLLGTDVLSDVKLTLSDKMFFCVWIGQRAVCDVRSAWNGSRVERW